ncbi:MAG: D-alanyl-D-alanine carboxypeptidase [Actinophytocola sp.]|uniref:D-alanyl-D-alanine carboxypeptidase family protein n=1 Tax=Actinophytocola sp. TaxID=1872138 RepID=UPI001326A287|nr:D-alanyl-D-alanine carboxypeptidase family protein [Actinophytocola sp.]MPZ85424.1 D-alanyl-D-alanine carboxypeptidase [Actinophytocola sp.]
MRVIRARASLCAGLALAVALLLAPSTSAQPGPEAGAPGAPRTDPRPGEAFADPKVAQLQRTAAGVQQELADLAGKIHDAERDLADATDAASAARTARERADATVAAQQAEVDAYTAAVYSSLAQPTELRALMSAGPDEFLDGAGFLDRLRADQDTRLGGAVRRQTAAEEAERAADATRADAASRRADLDRRTEDASNRAASVSSELAGVIADTDAAVVDQQRDQKQRNDRTAANWRAYLDKLAKAGIEPPLAAALRDPATLPAGLEPLPGQRGVVSITLASGEVLLVLPKETIAAVTRAVDALGKPYVPGSGSGGTGPAAYSCDGLVRAAFGGLPVGAARQMAVLPAIPPAQAQPGDLVFLGPERYGVQGVGIVLDGRTMLTADARLAGVVVTDLPAGDTVLGVARPSLGASPARAVPKADDGGLPWRCGGVELPPRAPGEAPGAWGGYPNGFIPLTALCRIGVGKHVLRCDAAAAFGALTSAYAATFGRGACVTDSYRTFAEQVSLYGTKPALAAVPGISNHGWAMALDLCGGAQSFASAEYAWLAANAPRFGWSNPLWARPGHGREEPWHWEFTG